MDGWMDGWMATIDGRVFRPLIGIYYGVEPDRIANASDALGRALDEMIDGSHLHSEANWVIGDAPTLAEPMLIPLYVRLDGLRRLGFSADLEPRVEAHRQRCRALRGWPAIRWSDEQTDEFVACMERFRSRRRATH
jgi:glutathione S-transferase